MSLSGPLFHIRASLPFTAFPALVVRSLSMDTNIVPEGTQEYTKVPPYGAHIIMVCDKVIRKKS